MEKAKRSQFIRGNSSFFCICLLVSFCYMLIMMMIFDILAKNNSFDIIAMIFYFLYIIRKQNKTKNPPNFQDRVPSKTQENV